MWSCGQGARPWIRRSVVLVQSRTQKCYGHNVGAQYGTEHVNIKCAKGSLVALYAAQDVHSVDEGVGVAVVAGFGVILRMTCLPSQIYPVTRSHHLILKFEKQEALVCLVSIPSHFNGTQYHSSFERDKMYKVSICIIWGIPSIILRRGILNQYP